MDASVIAAVLAAVVVLSYLSLAFELTILHVPSVASSRNILWSPSAVAAAYSPDWRGVFELPRWKKIALFILPVLVAWGVYLYPLIALLSGGDLLGDRLFATTGATNVIAAMLIVSGRAITLGSVLALRRAGTRDSRGHPITDGPFRYSRNPGLVGMYAFVSGLWLTVPSLTMVCGIVVYVVYMDFKVRMEEDYLGNTLGEAYLAYQRRTRRYLP